MRDNPARVRISDVLRSERERCATNQLNPRLSSAQASRIKQKSHQGDEQYWKAKNHSATELAVGETFPKRKSFALTQRNWVRSMLLTHSTSKDRNLCFLITVPVMALLLTAFLCSGNDSVLCNVHARLDVAADKKRRYLERAVDTVMHPDKNVVGCDLSHRVYLKEASG